MPLTSIQSSKYSSVNRQENIQKRVNKILEKIKTDSIENYKINTYIEELNKYRTEAAENDYEIQDLCNEYEATYSMNVVFGSIDASIAIALDFLKKLQDGLVKSQQLQQNAQFRRDINKLRFSLLQHEVEAPTECARESNKENWQKQLDAIKELYKKMGPETEVQEDIREEYTLIQREVDFVCKAITKEISETKRTIDIEEIKIPEFNGAASAWTSFYYLFKKFVHENVKLHKVEKMIWLKSLLDGEPLALIQHLNATDENYECAWRTLVQKFGNKGVLFRNLTDKVLDQPNVCSSSIADMKSLLDTTNECMQMLSLSDMNTDDIEPIIARIIVRKLDEKGLLRYELFINKKSEEMQLLDDVQRFLDVEHRVLQIEECASSKNQIIQAGGIVNDVTNSGEVTATPKELVSEINVETCLPINVSSSREQESEKIENVTSENKSVFIKKFFPPAPRPAGTIIKCIDLDMLAHYLNFWWGSDEFNTYNKIRDSGLYNEAWEMLESASRDMITRQLSRVKMADSIEKNSTVSQPS